MSELFTNYNFSCVQWPKLLCLLLSLRPTVITFDKLASSCVFYCVVYRVCACFFLFVCLFWDFFQFVVVFWAITLLIWFISSALKLISSSRQLFSLGKKTNINKIHNPRAHTGADNDLRLIIHQFNTKIHSNKCSVSVGWITKKVMI